VEVVLLGLFKSLLSYQLIGYRDLRNISQLPSITERISLEVRPHTPKFSSKHCLTYSLDPKSRALEETSLTLLDVRAAVEWAYEHIEAFGGDKDNIMVGFPFPEKKTTT
jgi:hypothetical protein